MLTDEQIYDKLGQFNVPADFDALIKRVGLSDDQLVKLASRLAHMYAPLSPGPAELVAAGISCGLALAEIGEEPGG